MKGTATGFILAAVLLSAITSATALAVIPDIMLNAIDATGQSQAATTFSEFTSDIDVVCEDNNERRGNIRLGDDYEIAVNSQSIILHSLEDDDTEEHNLPSNCDIVDGLKDISRNKNYEAIPENEGEVNITYK